MTFEQLKTFLAVADEGTFTRAGQVLYLSQPAVSQHVQALEKALGLRLFDRRGRRLALTTAGRRVVDYARAVMAETAALHSDLEGLDAPLQGTLSIGAIHSIGIYALPTRIAAFQKRHPSVRVELKTGSTEQIAQELSRGALDLAIVDAELPPTAARYLDRLDLGAEAYVLILPPDHPWAGRTDVGAGELVGERFVVRERRSSSRALLEGQLARAGVDVARLPVALELGSTEAIKQAVACGLGLGFVPASAVERELAWGTVGAARLEAGAIERRLWLYVPLRRGLPRRVHAFKDFLLEAEAPAQTSPR